MADPVAIALISTIGTILVALIGKVSLDLSRTKKDVVRARAASEKTESSINNRDSPLSDRLDVASEAALDALKGVQQLAETLKDHGSKLDRNTKDLRGIDQSVGILRGADRDLQEGLALTQRQLTDHMAETSRWTPMLSELHSRYAGNRPHGM